MNNCPFCKDTGIEPGHDDCVWCDSTGKIAMHHDQPAQQVQGKPVAYLRASDLERLAQPHVAGCAASLEKAPRSGFVAIYTHADPAEVSKWRNEAHRFNLEVERQKNLIESLRAELVESRSIDASAEPSAPVEVSDPCEWSDQQVLDFLGVALRNVDLQGEVRLSEIRQGFQFMRDRAALERNP